MELITQVLQMFPLEGLNLIPQIGQRIVTYLVLEVSKVDVSNGFG